MTPYYEADGVTIYHGDCRDVLPSLGPSDLVLTDPPYGINTATDNRRFSRGEGSHWSCGSGRAAPIIGDAQPFDPSFLVRYGKAQIIWGWNHYPNALPPGACLVWLKRYDPAFGSFLSDAELGWMSKGHGVYCRRDLSNNAHSADRAHPTQKPLTLMQWCLDFFPHAPTILDPFMGSGTTLVAAHRYGRCAIGIEIEERYCEIAAKRLEAARAQLTLWDQLA